MNGQQVFQRFCELTGLSYDDAEKYRWLCTNAMEQLSEMLVSNIDEQRCSGRLSAAAAAMAYYQYAIIMENSNVSSVRAGDITLSYAPCKSYAKEYLNQCLRALAPNVKDSSFIFRGVAVDKRNGNCRN